MACYDGQGYMAKKSFKHDKEKIAFIQAVTRAWLERAAYRRLRNAAILMQAAERCLMCSASYDEEKPAEMRWALAETGAKMEEQQER